MLTEVSVGVTPSIAVRSSEAAGRFGHNREMRSHPARRKLLAATPTAFDQGSRRPSTLNLPAERQRLRRSTDRPTCQQLRPHGPRQQFALRRGLANEFVKSCSRICSLLDLVYAVGVNSHSFLIGRSVRRGAPARSGGFSRTPHVLTVLLRRESQPNASK
jgi:hypothetical protein